MRWVLVDTYNAKILKESYYLLVIKDALVAQLKKEKHLDGLYIFQSEHCEEPIKATQWLKEYVIFIISEEAKGQFGL